MKDEIEANLLQETNNFQPVINSKSRKIDRAKSKKDMNRRIFNKHNFGHGEENISDASNEFEC